MNRNAFFKLSTGTVGGLCLPGLWETAAHSAEAPAAKRIAIDEAYLVKGLNAMARAHRISAMAGHLGASLVAGYFIGRQRPDLDPEVYRGIEGDLDQVMAGESVFGAKMTKTAKLADAELFEPFPKEKPNESLIDGIAEALAKNIKTPRESGHNVIFAAIAIHALKERPEFATASVIDGIRKLVTSSTKPIPATVTTGRLEAGSKGTRSPWRTGMMERRLTRM